MKPGIHPTWYPESVVTCACGNTFITGSTRKEIHTDVCSNCHPFFTGEQRIVDTAGQVERFMKRAGAKDRIAATRPLVQEKLSKKVKRGDERPSAVPVTPVAPDKLPLAVVEEKPEEIAPEIPAMAQSQSEPVVEFKPWTSEPVKPVESVPSIPPVFEPEPVRAPVAEAPKTVKKKVSAKKPAAKKKTAPKSKVTAKPKARVAKKPKTTAKKKSKR